jgi:hypothetical protein
MGKTQNLLDGCGAVLYCGIEWRFVVVSGIIAFAYLSC